MPFFCIETIISVKGICFKRESVGMGRAMGGARRAMGGARREMGAGTRRTGRGNRKVRRRENTAKGMCRISGEREGISTVTTTVHRMKGREAAGGAGGTISASPQRREKRPKTAHRRKSLPFDGGGRGETLVEVRRQTVRETVRQTHERETERSRDR
jgi:hypothetical protein